LIKTQRVRTGETTTGHRCSRRLTADPDERRARRLHSLVESVLGTEDSSSSSSIPRAGPTFAHQRWPSRGGVFRCCCQCGELAARGVIRCRLGLCHDVVGAPLPAGGKGRGDGWFDALASWVLLRVLRAGCGSGRQPERLTFGQRGPGHARVLRRDGHYRLPVAAAVHWRAMPRMCSSYCLMRWSRWYTSLSTSPMTRFA
jgi:hypothetical protein